MKGRFDDHHAELARILLDQIDSLSAKILRIRQARISPVSALNPTRGEPEDLRVPERGALRRGFGAFFLYVMTECCIV